MAKDQQTHQHPVYRKQRADDIGLKKHFELKEILTNDIKQAIEEFKRFCKNPKSLRFFAQKERAMYERVK